MRRFVTVLRDAWVVVGLTLLLFAATESAYRLWLAVRRPADVKDGQQAGHPYYGQAWYADFFDALVVRRNLVDPYRGHRQAPQASRYLNIDSAGRRVTPQPPVPPGAPRILLFGGSAMWGNTARDSMTIAAQLVGALARRGITGYEVENLAVAGYNSTQEEAAFLGELAAGRPVAAAVFFNGYNDVATALVIGAPGHTYSEHDAQTLTDIGRRGFIASLFGLGRFSAVVTRLGQLRPAAAPPPMKPAGPLCGAAAAWYANTERSVLDVARGRGIPALIFLQPHNASSHKHRTAWEEGLPRDPNLVTCADSLAAHMAPEAGRTFFDLRGAFDADTETVFVDRHSHVTEAANGRLAELIADHLAPLLRPAAARESRAAR